SIHADDSVHRLFRTRPVPRWPIGELVRHGPNAEVRVVCHQRSGWSAKRGRCAGLGVCRKREKNGKTENGLNRTKAIPHWNYIPHPMVRSCITQGTLTIPKLPRGRIGIDYSV